eukprot:198793_1
MISLLSFATLIGVNIAYDYFADPLTFEQAKASCIAKGTNLAVILDDTHRAIALVAIAGRTAPWIGLEDDGSTEHPNGNPGHGAFYYDSHPEDCPLDDGECVPFWYNGDGKHICLAQGGEPCTTYDPTGLFGNGAVKNTDDCDSARPYLCDEVFDDNGSCEDHEGFICTHAFVMCDDPCFCGRDDNDDTKCFYLPSGSCGYYSHCNADSDCDTDELCAHKTCCGYPTTPYGLCMRDCASGPPTTRRRLEEETGEEDKHIGCENLMTDETCVPAAKTNPLLMDLVRDETDATEDAVYNLSILQIFEMISLTALVTFSCSVLVFCGAFWCCLKTVHSDKKGGSIKLKYDEVSEEEEMM